MLKTGLGRSVIQKPLNGEKLNTSRLASMGKIMGTRCISRVINLGKFEPRMTLLGHSAPITLRASRATDPLLDNSVFVATPMPARTSCNTLRPTIATRLGVCLNQGSKLSRRDDPRGLMVGEHQQPAFVAGHEIIRLAGFRQGQ